jgi:hypothetical protein
MGAYPTLDDGETNPCFDVNRGALAPYWWDTPAEEACKHATGFGPGGIYLGFALPSFATGGRLNPDGGIDIATDPGNESPWKTLVTILAVVGVGLFGLNLVSKGALRK